MKHLRKFLGVIFLSFLTGCVGMSTHVATYADGKGATIGFKSTHITPKRTTKDQLLSGLGSPDRELVVEGREVWLYDSKLAWRGIVFWFLVPVPLLVPAGMNHIVVTFEGDTVREAYSETSENTFLGCILVLASCGYYPHGKPQLH